MSRSMTFALAALVFSAFAAMQLTAQDRADGPGAATPVRSRPAIGARIAKLGFKDIRYLERGLEDFGDKALYVIVAETEACPLNARYWPRLKALEAEFGPKKVQFLALDVGPRGTIKQMALRAIKYEVPFPFVKDMDGSCVRALGLTTTAQVAVLDGASRLLYRGRIDDQYRLGGARPTPSRSHLKEALVALLSGAAPADAETAVDGCRIDLAGFAAPRVAAEVNYVDHVAAIVKKHCLDCHSPGGLAPFNLLTYDDVAASAGMIAEVVADRRMPPWYGDEEHTGFENYRGLSSGERATLLAWVETGAPRGEGALEEPKQAPKPLAWRIGQPDLVITDTSEATIPEDGYLPYQYSMFFNKLPHDRWIEAIEIKPSNPEVVHHSNFIYTMVGEDGRRRKTTFVTGLVPGSGATFAPKGVAFRLPKGALLLLQTHYTTVGRATKCRMSVGFRFARKPVGKEMRVLRITNNRFEIPAGARRHEVKASRVLDRNAEGIALFSHMHLRGKDMSFMATAPGGERETLLVVPNYSFDWQQSYEWARGARSFAKGTRIGVTAHFDNSAFNPFNPDASKSVRYGQQTYSEMMFGFLFYVDRDEQLGLRVDPKTGAALSAAAPEAPAQPEPKRKPKKRVF